MSENNMERSIPIFLNYLLTGTSEEKESALKWFKDLAKMCDDEAQKQIMEMTFEINRELVLTTGHISEECNDDLDAHKGGNPHSNSPLNSLSIYELDDGWRILATGAGELPETDYPELDLILRFAQKHEIKWVVFDSDGPTHESFQKFDW